MRMIGSIPRGADDAERFSDYLVTQKIDNMVEESSAGGGWQVWVEQDDDLDRARLELDAFLKNPGDPKYDAQSAAQRIRRQEDKKAEKRRSQFVDYRTRWGQARQWVAPVTLTLIALSCILSLATNSLFVGARDNRGSAPLGGPRWNLLDPLLFTSVMGPRAQQFQREHPGASVEDPATLVRYWGAHLRGGEVWRLVTPVFLHLGILHLLFNMFWLRDLGGMIELQRGSRVLLLVVLATAVLSNVAQYFWSGPGVAAGMSGVVYGLFGYIWIKQRFEPHLGLGLRQETVWIMMAWLFICMTGYVGSIANAAHVMGLVVGAAYGYAPVGYRRMLRGRRA